MKLVKYLSHLGYGSRREVEYLIDDERVLDVDGKVLRAGDAFEHARIRIDGEPLDPAPGLLLMLNKPIGYVCSTKDAGRLVYDLLPRRYRLRDPIVSPIGRLDRDTSGLLLFTDDGQLLHRISSPKRHLPKIYEVMLTSDLRGDEVATFASGELMLESETRALAPALLEIVAPRHARVTLTEGRYHQVKRMFAAVGNHVQSLHRSQIGLLRLDGLPEGQWRMLDAIQTATLSGQTGN